MVLSEAGLLENFKSAKRRYCTVKMLSTGEVAVDIRKTRDTPPKRPQMIVQSAELRSMRKGRTVLEGFIAVVERKVLSLYVLLRNKIVCVQGQFNANNNNCS
ncbi:hypothetical protein COOONC_28333 [Cooperia oncophora]